MAEQFTLDVALDSSGITQGADTATSSLAGLTSQAGLVSGALKTAGVAAVAFAGAQGLGAAISAANQLQDELSALRSEVGLNADEVGRIRSETLDLASDTGEATQSIISGFKFARSAGLNFAESQELVETATKGAAAGFGEQDDLVRTATTALNAWTEEVDSGAGFLDQLAKSAQNMDIEVAGLSEAFRRNVNIASQLNISLEETLAGLGAVAGAAGDASRGGRLFQQVLSGLLSPTEQAEETISDVFGSIENLRRGIEEDGLIPTMVELRRRLQQSGRGMEDVFTSTRRLEGALALTADEGARANQILNDSADASGTVEKSFEDSATRTRQWRKDMATLNRVLINVGENLAGILRLSQGFSRFVDGIEGLAKAAGLLNTEVQSSLESLAGPEGFSGIERQLDFTSRAIGPQFSTVDQRQVREQVLGQLRALREIDPERFSNLQDSIGNSFAEGLRRAREQGITEADALVDFLQENVTEPWTNRLQMDVAKAVQKAPTQLDEQVVTASPISAPELLDVPGPRQRPEPTPTQIPEEFARIQDLERRTRTISDVREDLERIQELEPFIATEKQAEAFDKVMENLNDELDSFKEESPSAFEQFVEDSIGSIDRLERSFSDSLARMLTEGEFTFNRLGQSLAESILSAVLQEQVIGPLVGGFGGEDSAGSGILGFISGIFGDTPGVQETMQDTVVGFKAGDKFAAAQTQGDLQRQVSGGGEGKTVVINQTLEFPVTPESRIDQRIQKAAPAIQKQTKQAVFNDMDRGGRAGERTRTA